MKSWLRKLYDWTTESAGHAATVGVVLGVPAAIAANKGVKAVIRSRHATSAATWVGYQPVVIAGPAAAQIYKENDGLEAMGVALDPGTAVDVRSYAIRDGIVGVGDTWFLVSTKPTVDAAGMKRAVTGWLRSDRIVSGDSDPRLGAFHPPTVHGAPQGHQPYGIHGGYNAPPPQGGILEPPRGGVPASRGGNAADGQSSNQPGQGTPHKVKP